MANDSRVQVRGKAVVAGGSRRGRRTAGVLAAAVLLLAAQPTAGSTSADPPPSLGRTNVIHADGAASLVVELPRQLSRADGGIPSSRLQGPDGPALVVEPLDSFVGFTLVSLDERSGQNLTKLMAATLEFPDRPQVFFGSIGGAFDEDRVLPAGRYRLSVLGTDPVTVTLTLPGLDEGRVEVVATDPVAFHVETRQPGDTPLGSPGPTFAAGMEHTTERSSQVYSYVWVTGPFAVSREKVSCLEFGTSVEVAGVHQPGCGLGGAGLGFIRLDPEEDYRDVLFGSSGTEAARSYGVGGSYTVAGEVDGGGVLWMWVTADG